MLNDGGGGIFGLLEQGAPEHAGSFERIFGTPHTVDLAALAAAMGSSTSVSTTSQPSPRPSERHRGIRLAEIRADRTTLRAGHATIRAAIAAAL